MNFAFLRACFNRFEIMMNQTITDVSVACQLINHYPNDKYYNGRNRLTYQLLSDAVSDISDAVNTAQAENWRARLGLMIQARRGERDWSQTDLAREVTTLRRARRLKGASKSVSTDTISRIERGKNTTTDMLDLVLNVLGLDVARVFGAVPAPHHASAPSQPTAFTDDLQQAVAQLVAVTTRFLEYLHIDREGPERDPSAPNRGASPQSNRG